MKSHWKLEQFSLDLADLDPEAVALHRQVTEQANQILYRGTDKRNPK